MLNYIRIAGHLDEDVIKTITIAQDASLSGEIDLLGFNLFAIEMPSEWTTAVITLAACSESGGTFTPVYDDAGVEVTIQTGTSRVIGLDLAALKIGALRYIKIRSGTVGSAVTQEAARTLKLICK